LRSAPSRQIALADLCRRLVSDAYAPAAVLINQKHECLFSLGPTDRYLRVAPGHPTLDVLAMARPGLRTKLRSAIQQVVQSGAPVTVPGGRISHDDGSQFNIAVRPVPADGEDLLLVCFVEELKQHRRTAHPVNPSERSHVSELEHELAATKTELQSAIRNLEISGEEQRAINEEALSVNEEFQSTNEELLTSKEELQSLNEELTALNSQLQETLERQRTTSNDLQNVLYSTDVATLFLDASLNIRFFTPATKALFSILPGDIGRPLADLHSLAADSALADDARDVLKRSAPIEREIEAPGGAWFTRRILPYRTHDSTVEGVVITIADITDRKHTAKALEEAKKAADLANVAKSRFLAVASHDLRQPMQSLAFLQGLLAKAMKGEREKELVQRLEQTLGAMSGMLNTLLDINQIESGVVRPEVVAFRVNEVLDRLRDEFGYHAQARGLSFHVVDCSLMVESDPRLLEQMLRNLISNALKYTPPKGRILVGCRRRKGLLSIEIWDTGIGIAEKDQKAIFEEYHQVGNAARERSLGMGLGLSIVQRLGDLLHHDVRVFSRPGEGSVFAVEVPAPIRKPGVDIKAVDHVPEDGAHHDLHRKGKLLVIEDDPEVRELLVILLEDAGHRVAVASDGAGALEFIGRGGLRPDIVLADYSLPNGITGVQTVLAIRDRLHHAIPAIILTGDISTETLREVAAQNCIQLNKPMKAPHLVRLIQDLLPPPRPSKLADGPDDGAADPLPIPVIFIVDDNEEVREGLRSVLEEDGRTVEGYATSEAFLAAYDPSRAGCVLVDAYLPGMSGVQLLERLHADGHQIPAIMITGNSDVAIAVQAMKAGALDFIEKPVSVQDLLASVDLALVHSLDATRLFEWRANAAHLVAGLTPRQHEIMDLVLAGHPSKNIAADLGISQRTVETHRASIMKRTGSKSLPALARMALAASAHTAVGTNDSLG
jgi:two-component system CheB/CheR fusion protein